MVEFAHYLLASDSDIKTNEFLLGSIPPTLLIDYEMPMMLLKLTSYFLVPNVNQLSELKTILFQSNSSKKIQSYVWERKQN